jgi:hypothetical protein
MVRYLIVTARKGISSYQLATELGITQKSSWTSSGLVSATGSDVSSTGVTGSTDGSFALSSNGEGVLSSSWSIIILFYNHQKELMVYTD